MARIGIFVSFDMPVGATREDCAVYVFDAIASHKGGLHPDDVMFDLDSLTNKLRVRYKPTGKPNETITG